MTVHARVVAFAVMVLLFAGFVRAQTHPVEHARLGEASEEAKALGIGGYQIEHEHDSDVRSIRVDLLDLEKNLLGELDVEWQNDGSTLFELRTLADWIGIRWDPIRGDFRLSDLLTGEVVESRFAAGAWSRDDESERLIDGRPRAIALAALGLQDYLRNSGQRRPAGSREQDGLCPSGGCSPSCTGPIVRGTAFSNTRSWCCEQAQQDAAFQCWNEWCVGCCRYLSCDANCVSGDYFCVCGMTGFSCGPGCL